MAMVRTLLSLAITAMLIKLAMAANYTVGGPSGGWNTNTNLQSWASSHTFLVGDNLIFHYRTSHDVLEVTKADYDSCLASNPLQTYNGGTTIIQLSSPGKRRFICGTPGHCGEGMKIKIHTLATSAPPPASPLNPSTPATPTPLPASRVSPPASSPAQETSTPPTLSPKSARTKSLSSPSKSPMRSPTSSPDVPSTDSSTNTPSPSGSSPQPSPSSANKVNFLAGLTFGIGFVVMLLLAF